MLHIPLAILIQCIIAYFFDWNVGAAAASWYFIGREYAQAEYRLIEHYYGGRRANMPALAPLREACAWDLKSVLDWILPLVSTGIIAFYIIPYIQNV